MNEYLFISLICFTVIFTGLIAIIVETVLEHRTLQKMAELGMEEAIIGTDKDGDPIKGWIKHK